MKREGGREKEEVKGTKEWRENGGKSRKGGREDKGKGKGRRKGERKRERLREKGEGRWGMEGNRR